MASNSSRATLGNGSACAEEGYCLRGLPQLLRGGEAILCTRCRFVGEAHVGRRLDQLPGQPSPASRERSFRSGGTPPSRTCSTVDRWWSSATRKERASLITRVGRWIPAVSGLLTSAAVLLLIITGNIEAVAPVAALGTAITGGAAVKVNVHIRR
ncbi:hypothetical protein [Streptomyces violens]|uniref:hypothetical protein n=1 Tax=Streptomyces violens TaxID=66377 RepID=UPI0012FE934C|nr:hypothetical protein [Streptomyces violens]